MITIQKKRSALRAERFFVRRQQTLDGCLHTHMAIICNLHFLFICNLHFLFTCRFSLVCFPYSSQIKFSFSFVCVNPIFFLFHII